MMDNLTRTSRDRQIVAGMAAVFPPELLLAQDALLRYAARCVPGAWPDVQSVLRFARAYCVNPQELGAMVGIISFRLTPKGKLVWADCQRHPEVVARTNPGTLSRRVLRAYGCFVATAALVEGARRIH